MGDSWGLSGIFSSPGQRPPVEHHGLAVCWPPAETLPHLASRRRGAGVTEEDPLRIDDRESAVKRPSPTGGGVIMRIGECNPLWPLFFSSLSRPILRRGKNLTGFLAQGPSGISKRQALKFEYYGHGPDPLNPYVFCRWVFTVHRDSRELQRMCVCIPPPSRRMGTALVFSHSARCHILPAQQPWV